MLETSVLSSVDLPKQRDNASSATVTKYLIDVAMQTSKKTNLKWTVARRFSSFLANHKRLTKHLPNLNLPKLPPRQLIPSRYPDQTLVAKRRRDLDKYLHDMLKLPLVITSTAFLSFLGAPEGVSPMGLTDHGDGGSSIHRKADQHAEAAAQELGMFDAVANFARNFGQLKFELQPNAAAEAMAQFLDSLESRLESILTARVPSRGRRSSSVGTRSSFGASSPSSASASLSPSHLASCARDLLEDRLMTVLNERVFATRGVEIEADVDLHALLGRAQNSVGPESLEIDAKFRDMRFNRWSVAQQELCAMRAEYSPRAKLECVSRAIRQVKQGLLESLVASGHSAILGADELFPAVVLVLLRANPDRLNSNLLYMERWRRPSALKAENGCYLAHLQAAVAFLKSLAGDQRQSDGEVRKSEFPALSGSALGIDSFDRGLLEPLGSLEFELLRLGEGSDKDDSDASDLGDE